MSIKHHLVKGFLSLLARLPFPALMALARAASALAWHLNSPVRKAIETNINLCFPHITQAERNALIRQAILDTIKTGLEMPRLWFMPDVDDSLLLEGMEGKELVDQALADGRGIIMITPHLGLWEYFILLMGRLFPANVMCNDIDDIIPGSMNDTIQQARMKTGARILKARPGVKQLSLELLQQGKMIVIAPDQIPANKKAYVFADLFGHAAATMTLIPRLAASSHALIFTGFAKRMPDGRYRLVIRHYPELEQRLYGNEEDAALAMNQMLEKLIAEAPSQYLWTYKRFRLGPEGKRKIYKKIS